MVFMQKLSLSRWRCSTTTLAASSIGHCVPSARYSFLCFARSFYTDLPTRVPKKGEDAAGASASPNPMGMEGMEGESGEDRRGTVRPPAQWQYNSPLFSFSSSSSPFPRRRTDHPKGRPSHAPHEGEPSIHTPRGRQKRHAAVLRERVAPHPPRPKPTHLQTSSFASSDRTRWGALTPIPSGASRSSRTRPGASSSSSSSSNAFRTDRRHPSSPPSPLFSDPIRFAPYHETLSRPITRRPPPPHDGPSSSSSTLTRTVFDPALVVQVDSREKKIFLNPVQKSLVWRARRAEYQKCLTHLVHTLQSHLTPIEKCVHLLHLHETEIIPRRLRLRADTYDDIFHCFYASATLVSSGGSGKSGSHGAGGRGRAGYSAQQSAHTWEEAEELENIAHGEGADRSGGVGGGGAAVPFSSLGVPMELSSRSAAVLTLTSAETTEEWWKMYRYMVDSGTNPTPRILQHLMGLLEQRARRLGLGKALQSSARARHENEEEETDGSGQHSAIPSSEVYGGSPFPGLAVLEAKAHSLMMDADRFHFSPTTYTVNSYIFLCQVCGVMHLALARVSDLWMRWQQQPSSATYALLLHGFLHQPHRTTSRSSPPPSPQMLPPGVGFEKDATAFISTHQPKANDESPSASPISTDPTAVALSVLTTMQSTPITLFLLHEMMQVMRYSKDPLSCFTVYKSVLSRRTRAGMERPSAVAAAGMLTPTLHTFSILVEVLLRVSDCHAETPDASDLPVPTTQEKDDALPAISSSSFSPFPTHLLKFVLHEMKRYGVRGNQQLLNKLLECFRRSRQWKQLRALRAMMKRRGLVVFDEYRTL